MLVLLNQTLSEKLYPDIYFPTFISRPCADMENGLTYAFLDNIPETATPLPFPVNQQNSRVPHLLLLQIFQDSMLYFKHPSSTNPQSDAIVPLGQTQYLPRHCALEVSCAHLPGKVQTLAIGGESLRRSHNQVWGDQEPHQRRSPVWSLFCTPEFKQTSGVNGDRE
jgi:hypothetical protein